MFPLLSKTFILLLGIAKLKDKLVYSSQLINSQLTKCVLIFIGDNNHIKKQKYQTHHQHDKKI